MGNRNEKAIRVLKDDFYITEIPFGWAKRWLLERHYIRRVTTHQFTFGLFKKEKDELCGVATFGGSPSPTLTVGVCGPEFSEYVLEFNRLFVEDSYSKNTESFFVSKCLNFIEKIRPAILVSYADTEQGHVGYIYQALGWYYTGLVQTPPIIMIDGIKHHHRTIIDRKRTGITNYTQLKEKYGDRLEIIETKGKHRYVCFLGSRSFKKKFKDALKYKIFPYPKGDSKKYDTGKTWEKRGLIFKV